jgi:hypothetical protein
VAPPPPGATSVTCSYCRTVSSIQEAQRPNHPPAPASAPPAAAVRPAAAGKAVAIGVSMFALMSVVITLMIAKGGAVGGLGGATQWNAGSPPIFIDINGDRALDLVGRVRTFAGGDIVPGLAAFDGATGERLWVQPGLSAIAGEADTRIGVVGEHALYADESGLLRAFALKDGAPRWSIQLGERAAELCAADGAVVIHTADGQRRAVAASDGAAVQADPDGACINASAAPDAALLTTWRGASSVPTSWGERPEAAAVDGLKIEGMDAATQLTHGDLTVVLGTKQPGSRLPMVAALAGDAVVWSSLVPAAEPLKAAAHAPQVAAIDERAIYIAYELADGSAWRLTAFSRDGARLWEAPIPESENGDPNFIAPAGDRLYVAQWTYLHAFDRAGAHLHTIGRWR